MWNVENVDDCRTNSTPKRLWYLTGCTSNESSNPPWIRVRGKAGFELSCVPYMQVLHTYPALRFVTTCTNYLIPMLGKNKKKRRKVHDLYWHFFLLLTWMEPVGLIISNILLFFFFAVLILIATQRRTDDEKIYLRLHPHITTTHHPYHHHHHTLFLTSHHSLHSQWR